MMKTWCLQGSMIGRADHNGPQGSGVNDDLAFTLNTIDRHGVVAGGGTAMGWIVRRLTPKECERLQGFPDGWTDIKGKLVKKKGECVFVPGESPDSPRYKALGNSMAVPVMRWIGERIAEVEAKGEEWKSR